MQETRDVAAGLVEEGKLQVLQKGTVIDPKFIKGPIRLRLKQP